MFRISTRDRGHDNVDYWNEPIEKEIEAVSDDIEQIKKDKLGVVLAANNNNYNNYEDT